MRPISFHELTVFSAEISVESDVVSPASPGARIFSETENDAPTTMGFLRWLWLHRPIKTLVVGKCVAEFKNPIGQNRIGDLHPIDQIAGGFDGDAAARLAGQHQLNLVGRNGS